MPRGGARPGAGRKPNIPNKTKLTKIVKAKATGVMPATVMLENMRLHYAIAEAEKRRGAKADLNLMASELGKAHEAAKDVAPYYHSKLATLQSNVNLTGRLTLEDLVMQSLPSPANSNAPLIEGPIEDKLDAAE